MNNCELDERQLWLRGETFKHGLYFMAIMLLADTFLKSDVIRPEGIILVEGMWGNILIIVLTSAYCLIENALKGAMNYDSGSCRRMMLLFAVMGSILFIWSIADFILHHHPILHNHSLSMWGAELIMDVTYLAIGAIGLYKIRRAKSEDKMAAEK